MAASSTSLSCCALYNLTTPMTPRSTTVSVSFSRSSSAFLLKLKAPLQLCLQLFLQLLLLYGLRCSQLILLTLWVPCKSWYRSSRSAPSRPRCCLRCPLAAWAPLRMGDRPPPPPHFNTLRPPRT